MNRLEMGGVNSFGPGSRVRFGPYEVDFDSGELSKHGIRIKLQGPVNPVSKKNRTSNDFQAMFDGA